MQVKVDEAYLLPEQTFPGGEVGALEQSMLQNAFYTSQSLDDICPVVVQIPAHSTRSIPRHMINLHQDLLCFQRFYQLDIYCDSK